MKKSTLNSLLGLGFFVAVIVVLAVIFSNSISNTDSGISSYSTPVVDLSSLEAEAKSLIAGRENTAGIPIPVPKDKMGKTNPFSDPI